MGAAALPKLLIFASGTTDGGGSGFANLVKSSWSGVLHAEIVGVVSNHENGGVRKYADELGVMFMHFPGPYTAPEYRRITKLFNKPDFVALSGWLKMVKGLNPRTTFNIHPGPLPRFGGKGMHGIHVHRAVIAAYGRGEIRQSAVTMHFVTSKYDEGPILFQYGVDIDPDDTDETLANRVNAAEHLWQPRITDKIVRGEIHWDGKNPDSVGAVDWTK